MSSPSYDARAVCLRFRFRRAHLAIKFGQQDERESCAARVGVRADRFADGAEIMKRGLSVWVLHGSRPELMLG